jgi:hypothetical protein
MFARQTTPTWSSVVIHGPSLVYGLARHRKRTYRLGVLYVRKMDAVDTMDVMNTGLISIRVHVIHTDRKSRHIRPQS